MPKYADPAVYPVTAPAADDTAMARTNAGGDRNFLLGNLAALAPLAIANDQAPYFGGGAWGSYSLTTAGRALSAVAGTANTFPYFSAANVVTLGAVGATGLTSLAAATPAAGRTAIGAADDGAVVHLAGAETLTGPKTVDTSGSTPLSTRSTVAQTLSLTRRNANPSAVNNSVVQYSLEYTDATSATMYFGMNADMSKAPGFAVGLSANLGDTSQTFFKASATFFDIYGPTLRSAAVYPRTDNAFSCGQSGNRWSVVWAATGTISTSDAREKTAVRKLTPAEIAAAAELASEVGIFQWLASIEEKGQDGARLHVGMTVQRAIEIMKSHGLDPMAYGFICHDSWTALPEVWNTWEAQDAVYRTVPAVVDEDGQVVEPERMVEVSPAIEAGRSLEQEARQAGDRYGFREAPLAMFMVAAVTQRNDEMDARVTALEAKLTA